MPLTLSGQAIFNKFRTRSVLDLPAKTSEVMGSVWDEGRVHNPVASINRMLKIGGQKALTAGFGGVGGKEGAPIISDEDFAEIQAQKTEGLDHNFFWVDKESADKIRDDAGFTPTEIEISDRGANWFVLQTILEGKQAERERNIIIQRGSQVGLTPRLAAGLAATMIDPINIATSFLPFGGIRTAARLRAVGAAAFRRGVVRARVGAIEGAAGAALVEPLILSAARQDFLNYSIDDSMANILFGAVLGGGMHIGIGYMGDKIRVHNGLALDPQPRNLMGAALDDLPKPIQNAAAEMAVVASVRGRNVRVQEMINGTNGPLSNAVNDFDLPADFTIKVNEAGDILSIERVDADSAGRPLMLEDLLAEDLSPSMRDLIESSTDMNDFVKNLGDVTKIVQQEDLAKIRRVKEIQRTQNKKDIKTLLGPDATPAQLRAVLEEVESATIAGLRKGQELTASDPHTRIPGGDGISLKQVSDAFESPENLRSFDPARMEYEANVRERVPDDMDVLRAEQTKELGVLAKEANEELGIVDRMHAEEVEAAGRVAKEEGRVSNLSMRCLMGIIN